MAAESATGLVIVACCKEKCVTSAPVPALDLYEGWVVPLVRDRVAGAHGLRSRVLVLSALYGLITADTPVTTYEQPMTGERARALAGPARRVLSRHLGRFPSSEALLLMERPYADVLGPVPVTKTHLITDPIDRHADIHAVLNSWSWP
ncbi:hypothetical protein LKL35_08485 [Streptomyces sp. ET3-23]|uniref:DUF6884 domain-containing protein n=1 Tax=Streptomyces sp. ET3-23 TaxID=2885643 RepID=UPI001D12ECF4|nr:DUF6884 domain-containing protein [Streptomyces sp. ET3-23]MCC2275458.1 hypothetical protein [Streptomyces sp. ET3-23]